MSTRSVSERYLRVDTEQLIADAMTQVAVMFPSATTYTVKMLGSRRSRNTKHWAEVRFTDLSYMDPTGSLIIPMLRIHNSYAGESSLRVYVGAHRLVCSNGLVVPAENGHAFGERIRHVRSNEERVKQLSYQIVAALQQLDKVRQHLQTLHATPVTSQQGYNVIASLGYSPRLTKQIQIAWYNRTYGRVEDRGDTLYTLWNKVNEQLRLRSRSAAADADRNVDLLSKLSSLVAA